ncbi:DNA-binding transcriptional response regulator, NtrC family, contains REC, AAA-type ATPase, and a Fis-type DNA-binding domains [Desulfuromusa kysingii]|uniref:DNA-binding transcriptional response regulator, NtrC family, contains REC, AAA-type ATPase, and a Fis-type DNA-binding domains n=1 Tax=Desulfuromusa kysingii TaxID=37625 RepID=A0A1H3VST1_9BACT|nr:sigma-54 dependent transcriptional regulator [Desulfuromusa kysingii]SDZ77158.1 DNA-binding transcriptional response regulator, NtrC family, contains REC, AAA-type ATPase, and a Fis-type DNA-binding domains [Desulfuromusa kysingii]
MRKKGRILLLDDDELIISMLSRALRKEGYETQLLHSSEMAVEKIIAWQPDMMFLDIELGEELDGLDILRMLQAERINFPVVMLTGDDSSDSAIKALRYGASDYLHKPFNVEEVKIVVDRILKNSRMQDEIDYLKRAQVEKNGQPFIGESAAIIQLLDDARKIATAGVSSILITGKSGTGKEVLARNLHHWRFAEQQGFETVPFIAINCTALPENLIEGELFGHVKGAFTDAKSDKKGVFELANGGTLLLDEIGDMRPDLQGKLLRVLEERTVRRVGGKVDLPIDVTIIASTNRDLKKLVAEGLFREDLYYRLSSFFINIPPLCERETDVIRLTEYFLQKFAQKYSKKQVKTLAKEAEELMLEYLWPGNVRELRNVIERCVVMESAPVLGVECLPLDIGGRKADSIERRKKFQILLPEEGISLEEVEREYLQLALERTNNNMTKAAKLLKVSYDVFRYQAKKYNLL